jgi:hypothetical protein
VGVIVATSETNTAHKELKEMILSGQIPLEEIVKISKDDVYMMLMEQYKELGGVAIGRASAAQKYNVPVDTLRAWEKKGFIEVLSRARGQGQQVMLNERDVVVTKRMYQLFSKGTRGAGIPGWRRGGIKLAS